MAAGAAAPQGSRERIDAPGCHADRADHDHHRTRRSVLRVSLAAPALLEHGAPELQRPLLRAIATCRDTWRQLFSEPSNGSDRTWPASPPTPAGGRWSEGSSPRCPRRPRPVTRRRARRTASTTSYPRPDERTVGNAKVTPFKHT